MRLTDKDCNGRYYIPDSEEHNADYWTNVELATANKLGQLEDIEEQFGIELIPFLNQLAEAIEQLKKNGLKFKAVNFQAKGKKYKLEELK